MSRAATPIVDRLASLVEIIESTWSHKRILVVGDVMLDKYIRGEVERVSPEAPVPIVRALKSSTQPGGAANVAMNLAGLTAQTTVIGLAGDDEDGITLRNYLQGARIRNFLFSVPGFPTISKLRILGGQQQMLRLDVESRDQVPEATLQEVVDCAIKELQTADAVVLSDYAKGTLNDLVCGQIIGAARTQGIPVLADPKTQDFGRYRGATTLSPNLHELAAAVGVRGEHLPALFAAAKRKLPEWELGHLIVTLGERGIAVLREDSEYVAPAVAQQVFDVSGAGDTVIAVLALCFASAISVEDSLRLANVAAGVVVSQVGTVPVQKREMLEALVTHSDKDAQSAASKLFSPGRLETQLSVWRASGQKIAFTNGCFDLLHVGHIEVLEAARKTANRLIVGLNSDTSVRRIKGLARPVVAQEQRARVLGALSSVDAVVFFDEDTPLRLIKEIRPEVLVKGGDYSEATIVGAAEVQSWGGKVVVVPLVEGSSTTRLIAHAGSRLN